MATKQKIRRLPGQFDEEVLQRKVYQKNNVRAQPTKGAVELGHGLGHFASDRAHKRAHIF